MSKGSFGLKPRPSALHHPSASNDSVATPSSVHVAPKGEISLTRDLSDLSGSYMNGNTAVRSHVKTIPINVYPSDASGSSYQRPWKQAKVLSSSRLPFHPQPPADDESSVGIRRKMSKFPLSVTVDKGEVIEVAMEHESSPTTTTKTHAAAISVEGLESAVATKGQHKRTPIILVLMDPQRKQYELMQLWMDSASDAVRDVLQAITRNLENWRQDYDGLFAVRNNHFSQLIHVLQVGKYDVVPGEVWVAKPWSMSAKATVGYASTLLNHLKQIGVLQYARASDFDSKWKQLIGRAKHGEDTVLILSKEAQKRVYVPDGILKHHHACQFLSFTPPFEGEERVDVLSGGGGGEEDAASALSDSHYGGSEASEEPLLQLPAKSPEQEDDDDAKSQAESTYSTTGTGSPMPRRKVQDPSDAMSNVSAVTRESSYQLKPRSPNAPLPHVLPSMKYHHHHPSQKDAQRGGGGIVRLLASLNCSNKAEKDPYSQQRQQKSKTYESSSSSTSAAGAVSRSSSRLTTATAPLGRTLEEDAHSQCSGAPLLFTQNDTRDWTTTVSI